MDRIDAKAAKITIEALLDDNTALRELFAHWLTKQPGVRCTRQVPSAEAVLATLAEERPPDMILLDINLGGQSGWSAYCDDCAAPHDDKLRVESDLG